MSDKTKEIFPIVEENVDTLGAGFGWMRYMAAAGETLPPWWSQERDRQLRIFSKGSDSLAGTINMMQEMIGAIPIRVEPKDNSIMAHRRMAELLTDVLLNKSSSQSNLVGTGWQAMLNPFVNDITGQDNGGWLVVEGESDDEGLLVGVPTKLIHLDSYNCWRTLSREYPLIYTDRDGKRYKIHRSRVINITSSPDPSVEMCGVGFCAVSRSVNMVQRLTDINRYYQEKLGTRPPRGFLFVTGTGAERGAKAIENSVFITNEQQDNEGLSRFSRIPVIGLRDGNIQLISFSDLPDGFNELQTVQIGVWILSLAFGVDSRQLGFALGVSGQTKADAEIQHQKMQGKFPGWFLGELTRQLDNKFLPPYLKAVFDQQDDAQDMVQAEQRKVRSEYRKTYHETALWTSRITHEDMLETGDITDEQFIQLELEAGRLEDGLSIMSLFEHPDYQDLLITDDPETRLKELYGYMSTVKSASENKRVKMAIAALEYVSNQTKQDDEQVQDKLSLNGRQIRALRETLREVQDGDLVPANAVQVLMSLGIPQSNAEEMVNNALQGDTPAEVIEEEVTETTDEADSETDDEKEAKKKDKAISAYGASIRATVTGLFKGHLDIVSFIVGMNGAIERGFEQAWTEGALTCGIKRNERTTEEINQLNSMIATNKFYIYPFGEWIENLRDNDGTLTGALARAELWTNRYNEVKNKAQVMACADAKLKWVVGPTEHCRDCQNYNGRVYRASIWNKYNIAPQSSDLACRGYRCQCKFEQTSDPVSKGRPPGMKGPKKKR